VHEALLGEFERIFSGRELEPLPDVQQYKKLSSLT